MRDVDRYVIHVTIDWAILRGRGIPEGIDKRIETYRRHDSVPYRVPEDDAEYWPS